MSTPISHQRSGNDSFVSSSESLVESSSHETPSLDEQSKSPASPVMKTKTKKSAQRDAYKASSSSSSAYAEKNHDIGKNFKKEIDIAREKNGTKQLWKKFSNRIDRKGILELNRVDSPRIHELLNYLHKVPNAKITRMHVNSMAIDAIAATALAKAIKSNTQIVELELLNTAVEAAGFKDICDATIINTESKITKLEFIMCDLKDEHAKVLANAIISNPSSNIAELDLSCNRIGNEGAKALAEAISHNPNSKVSTLTLSDNRIGDGATKALANAIKSCNNIRKIALNINYINDDGAIALAEAIKTNSESKLDALYLNRNKIKHEGILGLADAIKVNRTITSLNIDDNQYSKDSDMDRDLILQQCALNHQKPFIENNIIDALNLLTQHPNPNDGNMTSVLDVNKMIAQKLFVLDKADKLIKAEVVNKPDSVFNKYV
jgi:Ran GTPase-activating protein (RanGAP) involved in mRNA processing and transport